jgi:peptide/nickel transport system substrate-binding protein
MDQVRDWLASRRGFLTGASAALAVAGHGARAAEPTRLVGVLEETPSIINPAITAVISSYCAGTPVYNALTHIKPDGTIQPELAESWETSPDGKTITFRLRHDVLWHDGQKFTAADVRFSLQNGNGKLHPWGRGAFRSVASIDTPDDYTVVLHLSEPSAALMFGTDAACGAILPRHIWEGSDILKNPRNLAPIGTGPYKFVELRPGDRVRYVRNDKYFVKDQPYFDELVLRIIPDPPARVAAFENREVDTIYMNALPFSEAPHLATEPGVTVRRTNLRGAGFMGIFNVRSKPYSDVRVRQAIAHAIDRGFIRDNVDKGFTIRMLGPVPPASPLYNPDLKDYDFDPALANRMLDDAGFPKDANGTRFAFRFLFPAADAGVTRMGDVIRQNLSAVGIDVRLQPLDRAALVQRGYVALEFDMLCESYGLGPDPDIGVERLYNSHNIFHPPVPYTNASGYVNPAVDALFDEQRVQLDFNKRKDLYARIQELIWADVPVLPMFSYEGPNAFRNTVVTGLYEGSYGNMESFALARPPGGADVAAATGGGRGWMAPAAAGAVVVAGAGVIYARRRRHTHDQA